MKRIRIKKEIALVWAVTINGHEEALAGKDLSLFLIDPKYKKTAKTFTIQNTNEVKFRVLPAEQTYTGVYTLELWANYGKTDQSVVDRRSAFELVQYTPLEDDGLVDDIHAAEVYIGSGNLAVGIHGRGIVKTEKVSTDPNDPNYKIFYDDGTYNIITIARGEKGLTDAEHAAVIAQTTAAQTAAAAATSAASNANTKAALADTKAALADEKATAANTAAAAATTAKNEAQSATSAAQSATTAANNAATSASNAAATANAKAEEARTAALNASNAATSANNAATAANAAKTAAETATTNANNAASNASTKATAANTAASAANTAASSANSAASSATSAATSATTAAEAANTAAAGIDAKIATKANQSQVDSLSSQIGGIESELGKTSEEKTYTGKILSLSTSGMSNPTFSKSVRIIGKNLFDESKKVYRKILNDSGVETADYNSSYYDMHIPVVGGATIGVSCVPQRIYLYRADGSLIARIFNSQVVERTDGDKRYYDIPATFNSNAIASITFQFTNANISTYEGAFVCAYGNDLPDYEAYSENSSALYSYSNICATDYSEFAMKVLEGTNGISVPAFAIPQVWQPTTADSGYSSPIGQNNVFRENWSATDKYDYYGFIEHYYDRYVGGSYNSGYKVTKRSLGADSSNDGYELFEFDFCPNNYSRVVMISAGMNSCETSGIWGLATFMQNVMESSESGMKFLHDNVRFKVLPIICPNSFDQTPLKYANPNNVRVNKNFNYRTSWKTIGQLYPTEPKGSAPDSEAETRILKEWVNKYSGIADLWIDCHSDSSSTGYTNILTQVICSNTETRVQLTTCFAALKAFYTDLGYIPSGTEAQCQIWVEPGYAYPKQLYSYKECGIPSIMIEQYVSSQMFGSDGATNNDVYGIKNYVTMLRLYIFTLLESAKKTVASGSVMQNAYKLNYK